MLSVWVPAEVLLLTCICLRPGSARWNR